MTGPVDVPPAPRSAVLCAPWATFADVPAAWRDVETEDEWTRDLLVASEILFYLSGRRFYGGGCTETVTLRSRPSAPGEGTWPYEGSWGDCACWTSGTWLDGWLFPPRTWMGRHYEPFAIRLPRAPVTAVTSVLVGGVALTAWRLARSGFLERTDGQPWAVCGDATVVDYQFGIAPPESGVQAAVQLAYEMALARIGSSDCQLPQRVQSLTRQGVTMTILDPQEFLSDGRTGLYSVDLFLSAINPHGRGQRGKVWSPDIPVAFKQ